MIKSLQVLFGVILLISFYACNMEEARPAKTQKLLIVSDCLEAKDTLFFSDFIYKNGIKIKILHLSADDLEKVLIKEGVNTEIDLIILSSMFDMSEFEKKNLLQRIHKGEVPINLPKRYVANSKKWAGIGIDPYVLITLKDSTGKIRTYKDLTKTSKWCSTLKSKSDWYPFYAPIVKRMDPKKEYNSLDWIKHFQSNDLGILKEKDSVSQCDILLSRYSVFRTDSIIQKTRFKKGKLIFPNQRTGGSYYNMYCFGIVSQARNYQNALSFFDYLMKESVNKRINNKWKTFPIITNNESPYFYQNIRYKKYGITPIQFIDYYNRVRKVQEMIK